MSDESSWDFSDDAYAMSGFICGSPYFVRPHLRLKSGGGARRFEPDIHIDEHLRYWKQLMQLDNGIDAQTLFREKMGYKSFPAFREWKLINHYEKMEDDQVKECYENESQYYQRLNEFSLAEYANRHYKELSEGYKSMTVLN